MYMPPRVFVGLAVCAAIAFICIVNSVSARDPTSVFFNPRKGYAPRYSSVRRQQAQHFIASYSPASVVKAGPPSERKLCVGIVSVKRQGEQYLQDSVGSLLAGLAPEERRKIYLMVFIAHSKPANHPAYGETWLAGLADEVITYPFGIDRMQYIVDMERKSKVDEKALYDYSYLLEKCSEQLTPYVAMLEDDILAMDGWYHRTIVALHSAEEQAALLRAKPDFLYLRLFYTEEFLGWHRQYWFTYLLNSICIAVLISLSILIFQYLQPATKVSMLLTTRRTLVMIYSTLAIIILLYFALGRLTVRPLQHGVHEMPRFGCCNQAMVFPNTKAVELVTYLKERHVGYVDVLTEDFANEHDELRYAITPSVFQHIGRKSSHDDDGGYEPTSKGRLSMEEKIWSFSFEKLDEEKLRLQHETINKPTGKATSIPNTT